MSERQVTDDSPALERAQRNQIKYQVTARQFEAKHGQPFEAFRQRVLTSEPAFQVEQDYFDWELAVTGIADMQAEIQHLRPPTEGRTAAR